MGLFRILALFLLFYFLIKFLGRVFRPYLNKQNGNQRGGQSQNSRANNRAEGDVTIEYTNSSKGSKMKDGHAEGEYVDFEELD